MSAVNDPAMGEDRARRAAPGKVGLTAAALLILAATYRQLGTLGPRYTVESGVESFLFSPNDRAPVIVLALAAWLAWRRHHRLAALPSKRGPLALVVLLLAVGFAIHAWAFHVRANDLQAFSLMAVSSALLVYGWGLPGLRALWLPVAFLAFCIPIPAPALATWLWELRLFTAEYTGWLLYLLGVPALVSGDQILRAQQTFQVVDGCSGLRSIETLTMLVILLIDLFGRRGLHAAILLLVAPWLALVLNGVRVLTLVLNPHSEIVAIHSLQGIAILLAGLLLLYFLDGLLWRLLPHGPLEPSGRTTRATAGEPRLAPFTLGVGLCLLIVGLVTPVWDAPRRPLRLEDLVRGAIPETDTAREIKEWGYFRGHASFREKVHRRYGSGPRSIELFIGTANLRDRRGTIVSPVNSRPGSGWGVRRAEIARVGPDRVPVLELSMERGLERELTWSFYLGTGSVLEEALRNLAGLERSELRREGGQLVVRLSTPAESLVDRDAEARDRLEAFFARIEPAVMMAISPEGPSEVAEP